MQNLKIRVNSEAESREVQELFFELGGTWGHCGNNLANLDAKYFHTDCMEITCTDDYEIFIEWDGREITLTELRAMVSPMKEWLNTKTHEYKQAACMYGHSEWIEIPELSQFAVLNGDDEISFYDGNGLEKSHFISSAIIWQRDQDEPFLTPECTLNNQYAEIEQVRQAVKDNVNHPSHYAGSAIECIDAMEAMMTHEQFIGYLRGNLFKYQWRYEKKNGIEDLKKAQWYLEKLTAKVAEKNAPF